MRLAFLDLPDDRVDLISLARQAPGVVIVLVAHSNPDALALKIAEVLQIPHSTEPLDLLALKPDRVALPSFETSSAAALSRAGISSRIFTTLNDLSASLGTGPRADATGNPTPLEGWEALFDEATGTRLGKIQEALALSEDRQRLFREILALAVEQTGAEAGSIMIVDEDDEELRIAFADGLSPDTVRTTRQKLGEGVAGKVAKEGRPLIINERISDPRFRNTRERSRITCAMSAPIQLDSRVIGVINVSSDHPEKLFCEQDLDKLTETASQISAILERVVQGLRRDADAIEFRARRAMEQALAREDLPLLERLRLVATRLAGHLDAEAAHLYMADAQGARLTVISSGTEPGVQGDFPLSPGLLAHAFRKGESVFLASRLSRPSDVHTGEAGPNLVVVPIVDTRIIGVLVVECIARVSVDLEDFTRLVARLGRLLARLTETRGGHAASTREGTLFGLLSDIAPRLMIQHDLDSLLTESVGALRELFGSGLVTVRLVDRKGDVLLRSKYEGSEADRAALAIIEEELASAALEEGIEASSIAGAPEILPTATSRAEFAVVPVHAAEQTIGALSVALPTGSRGRTKAPALGTAELGALRKLALYVALAWAKSRSGDEVATSLHDEATGLLGGSALESRILEEVKRAERYHERFLLTLCSISGFEQLEDLHGSEWAERFVAEFAKTLTKNVREVDTVARISGGRFAVLSPETEKDGGALLKRLDLLLPRLETVGSLPEPSEIRLVGRQYLYPEEVPTGGELLDLIRGNGPGA